MTRFIGTTGADTIVPGFVSPGVQAIGPDATPGTGDDLIIGRAGDDTVAGGLGEDKALLGAGDDIFGWAPADGSDEVDGGAGFDSLIFDGSDDVEAFDLDRRLNEVRLTRDLGDVEMRLDAVERIDLFAGGGADTITAGPTRGTDLQEFLVDLAAERGGDAGDGAADTVALDADAGASFLTLTGSGDTASVIGLDAFVGIRGAEAGDTLRVNGRGGDDFFGATGFAAAMALTLDGGSGDDTILSGTGDDLLLGRAGSDFVVGGRGDDTALLGAGNDTFVWFNGDGSDRVEGGSGKDSLGFDGFEAAEFTRVFANGSRTALTRDLGNIVMDFDGIERIDLRPLGGEDVVAIEDLTGTDVEEVEIVLSLPGQSGDGAGDLVDLTGGGEASVITLTSTGATVDVEGLPALVRVVGLEAQDLLSVTAGGADDVIDATGVADGVSFLGLEGGAGNDTLLGGDIAEAMIGGDGDDIVVGGNGDDNAFLGAGDDAFFWAPGDDNDTINGDDGTDTLGFLGADIAEVIDIFEVAGRAIFFRDIAAVTMDLTEVERIVFNALGGEDIINVGDLAGTDVTEIVLDLSASGGGGDGAADRVVIDAAGAGDVDIARDGGDIVVSGLAAMVRIVGSDADLDRLEFIGLGGGARIAGEDDLGSEAAYGMGAISGSVMSDADLQMAAWQPLEDPGLI